MRKIAIITSGKAEAAKRVASLFNEGNRIRVSAIVCDSPEVAEVLKAIDSSMLVLTVADIVGQKEEIAKMLADSDIEKIALENINLQHFEEEGKAVLNGAEIFIITSEEEAPREVVGAFKEEAPALPEKAHLEEK
ncbi:MAG: hypothetical protein K2K58_07775, partial [Muribaculaceae bacterium]|nr:hypothetical protein [Muribaculaceae bacterium]